MANKYEITNELGSLKITRKWWSKSAIFFVFFSLFWNGIVLVFLLSGAGWMIGIHLLVGIFIGWYTLATVLNTTAIEASPRELSIEHGPLPWPFQPNRHLTTQSVKQLYVDKSSVRINNQTTYHLIAKLDTGAQVKLLTNQQDREMLTQLETAIESHLNIENDVNVGYQEAKLDQLDLEQLNEHMEKLEPIMKWLPKSMVRNIEEARQKAMQQNKSERNFSDSPRPPFNPPRKKGGLRKNIPASQPERQGGKDLYVAENPINFPLYASREGTAVHWKGAAWTVERTAQIDFVDTDIPTGRMIELVQRQQPNERTYVYAQEDHNRWNYAEERRLDDEEVAALGFTETSISAYPMKLENGDDRYYPRSEQVGTLFAGSQATQVKQYLYFTVGTSTQFRALLPEGGNWQVYVQEVVDAGDFSGSHP
ncbi:hypothetical protein [Lewinella sp. 4G2]|uniref:hypothetical protein n=1 Tax=Lewinella sp. 4G2 TaxID=1803372 RepID=UPI0007B48222|nr:hypothetical protein [Lewinella sp. 4G2]OAV44506.1 hypothetical protein A3850_008390 [Lewinella sp. 4G2]